MNREVEVCTPSQLCESCRRKNAIGFKSGLVIERRTEVDPELSKFLAREAALNEQRPLDVIEVRSFVISDHVRELARKAAEAACQDLGLSLIRVRWFKEPSHRNGFFDATYPNQIWLHRDLLGADMVRTIGHECYHAHLHDRGRSVTNDEAKAAAYGARLRASDWSCWPWAVRPRFYEH